MASYFFYPAKRINIVTNHSDLRRLLSPKIPKSSKVARSENITEQQLHVLVFFFNVGFLGVLVVAGFCAWPCDGVPEVGIFGA